MKENYLEAEFQKHYYYGYNEESPAASCDLECQEEDAAALMQTITSDRKYDKVSGAMPE